MTFTVSDMSCHHCVKKINAALSTVAGVEKVSVDLSSKKVEVEGPADAKAVLQAIRGAGYTAGLDK